MNFRLDNCDPAIEWTEVCVLKHVGLDDGGGNFDLAGFVGGIPSAFVCLLECLACGAGIDSDPRRAQPVPKPTIPRNCFLGQGSNPINHCLPATLCNELFRLFQHEFQRRFKISGTQEERHCVLGVTEFFQEAGGRIRYGDQSRRIENLPCAMTKECAKQAVELIDRFGPVPAIDEQVGAIEFLQQSYRRFAADQTLRRRDGDSREKAQLQQRRLVGIRGAREELTRKISEYVLKRVWIAKILYRASTVDPFAKQAQPGHPTARLFMKRSGNARVKIQLRAKY